MNDNYTPATSSTLDPIFEREFVKLSWTPDLATLRREDWAFAWMISAASIMVLFVMVPCSIGIPTFGQGIVSAIAIFALLAPIAATVGADLYMTAVVAMYWHSRTRGETLDVLRLAAPDDFTFLTAYQRVAEIMTWRAMRLEMGVRAVIPAGLLLLGIFTIPALVLETARALRTNELDLLANVYGLVGIILSVALLYLREPLWRMRVMVALTLGIASRVRETNAAILLAGGAALALKLLQGMSLWLLLSLSFWLMATDSPLLPLWFVTLTVGLNLVVRRVYATAHRWLTHETIRHLNAG